MNRLFDSHILSLLEKHKPREILEIGVLRGDATLRLLRWCSMNNAHLTSIDPVEWEGDLPDDVKAGWPGYQYKRGKDYGETRPESVEEIYRHNLDQYWTCRKTTSIDFLSNGYGGCDLALIDGDHNYYTVSNELRLLSLKAKTGDVFLLHDISRKSYARKDFYYDRTLVPLEWQDGKKQGVLTAIKDFMDKGPGTYGFKILTKKNDGLGEIIKLSNQYRG